MNTVSYETLKDLREKMTVKEIAKHLGISEASVGNLIKKHGLQKRANFGNTKKPKPSREELKAYLFDHSQAEAAKHFGLAQKTILNTIREYSLTEEECKYSFVDKETFIELRKKHSIADLAKMLKVSRSRIEKLIEIHGITEIPTPRKNYVIESSDVLITLIDKYNQPEIADMLGVSMHALLDAIKRFGLNYPRKKPSDDPLYGHLPSNLTDLQKEIITGNLLGDGSIPNLGNTTRNNYFSFGQKEANKEYVEFIHRMLTPYSRSIVKTSKEFFERTFYTYSFDTATHPIFTNLRNSWYKDPNTPNSQKIIPRDLKLTWRMAAYWFADDGCNSNTTPHESVHFATECFLPPDIEFICNRLKEDLGIETTLNTIPKDYGDRFRIRIGKSQYKTFLNGIRPYLSEINCMKYKLLNHEERKSMENKTSQI